MYDENRCLFLYPINKGVGERVEGESFWYTCELKGVPLLESEEKLDFDELYEPGSEQVYQSFHNHWSPFT